LYPHAALSPDGNTVVAPVVGTQGWDLWAFDLAGGAPRRLTFENASILDSPAWSTNGSDLFFSMWRGPGDFGIYRVPAYGSRPPELVVRGTMLADFTSDGGTMIYGEPAEGFEVNLWMRELDGDETGTPLLTDVGYEVQPALSPDDRFLAYSHQDRILVRSFPDMGGPWQIGPGWSPRWSPDGTRLYYLNGDALMEVEVSTGGQFRFASPAPLFNFEMAPALLVGWPLFDVTPDGERFIMVRTVERPPGMVLVQNWPGAVE
ncbi:MAG: TolB family protein, partial [Acidobacteriota bacterium]